MLLIWPGGKAGWDFLDFLFEFIGVLFFVGGAAVLGTMAASASYIAAPAAVRIALPKASPGIYLTLALGITFPFNLIIGIPLFLKTSQWLTSLLP